MRWRRWTGPSPPSWLRKHLLNRLQNLLAALVLGSTSVAGAATSVSETTAVISPRCERGFAVRATGDSAPVDPSLLKAYLVGSSPPQDELVFPLGQCIEVPPGDYALWIEGDGKISPAPYVFRSGIEATDDNVLLEIAPAARLLLDPELELSEGELVHVLSLPASGDGEKVYAFQRTIEFSDRERALLVPEGKAVALLYDRKAKRYSGVCRPVETSVSAPAFVAPLPEVPRTDVLAILDHPSVEGYRANLSLRLRVPDAAPRLPDVIAPLPGVIYAIWYDVSGRSGVLEGESNRLHLIPAEIPLVGTGIETHRGRLQLRPSLRVGLELPPSLNPEALKLVVSRLDDRTILFEKSLGPELQPTEILDLPPAELVVSLTVVEGLSWTMRQTADLREVSSREVIFKPESMILSGRVLHGNEPSVASLRIFTDQTEPGSVLTVDTDEDGYYEASFWSKGRYPIHTHIPELHGPDYKIWSPYIEGDTVFDIQVPRSDVVVRVRNSADGTPIAGARVVYTSTFTRNGKRGGNSRNSETDSEGLAALAPIPPGELVVEVTKEGFLPADPVIGAVEEDASWEISVGLEPLGDTTPLAILLPDGRPAGLAELRAQRSAWDEPPLWEGRANQRGVAEIPDRVLGSWLLIRHPEAGSWIQGWSSAAEPIWVLPLAGGSLTLRSVGAGESVQAWSGLALRFPQAWVAGSSLAWLACTTVGGTNGEGLWRAERLPALELRAVAGSVEIVRLALEGFLDGSAETLSPPWSPGAHDLHVID